MYRGCKRGNLPRIEHKFLRPRLLFLKAAAFGDHLVETDFSTSPPCCSTQRGICARGRRWARLSTAWVGAQNFGYSPHHISFGFVECEGCKKGPLLCETAKKPFNHKEGLDNCLTVIWTFEKRGTAMLSKKACWSYGCKILHVKPYIQFLLKLNISNALVQLNCHLILFSFFRLCPVY